MFCDIYGSKCFDDSMDKLNFENNCDCPTECNSITYSFTTVSTPFNVEEYCPPDSNNFLMKPFYDDKFPHQFIRKLLKIKNNVSDDAVEYCKKNLEYRAEVIFRMATDTMSVTVMSPRLSFFDKMSAFGKLCAPQAPDRFNPKVRVQTCGIIQKLYETKHIETMMSVKSVMSHFSKIEPKMSKKDIKNG